MLPYTKQSLNKKRSSLNQNVKYGNKRKSLFSNEQSEQVIFPYQSKSHFFVENPYSDKYQNIDLKCAQKGSRKSINVSEVNTREYNKFQDNAINVLRKSFSTFNSENQLLQQQLRSQFINELQGEYDIWIEYHQYNGSNGYYMYCIRNNAFQLEMDNQPVMSLVEYNQLQKIEQRRKSIGVNIDWNELPISTELPSINDIYEKKMSEKIVIKSQQTKSPKSKSPNKSPLRSPLSSPRSRVIMTKRINQQTENTDDLLRIESLDEPKEEKNDSSVSMRKQSKRNTKMNNRMNTVQSLHVDSLNSDLLEEINKMNAALDLTELNTISEFQSISDPSILEAMNTLNAINPKSSSSRKSFSNTDFDTNVRNEQKEHFKEKTTIRIDSKEKINLQRCDEKTLHVNGGLYLKDFVNEEIKIVGYSKNGNLIPFDASIQNIIVDRILCSKTTILEFDKIPNIRIKKFDLFDAKPGLLVPENK